MGCTASVPTTALLTAADRKDYHQWRRPPIATRPCEMALGSRLAIIIHHVSDRILDTLPHACFEEKWNPRLEVLEPH